MDGPVAARRALVATPATLHRLGHPLDVDDLLPYARTAEQAAVHDLDRTDLLPTDRERAEYAVAPAVLFEPVLLNLRRLTRAEESNRRHGLCPGAARGAYRRPARGRRTGRRPSPEAGPADGVPDQ